MSAVSPTQELVERWATHQIRRRSGSDGRKVRKALGLRARPSWGSSTTTIDDITVDFRVCGSPLGVRQALSDHDPRDLSRQLVVITDFNQHDLGADVLARLADGRLRTIEEREIVSAMFHVQSIEPRLRRDNSLIQALIDYEPAGGWQAEPSGLLTYDRAAELLLAALLGLSNPSAGLNPLLAWASSANASLLQELDGELRGQLVGWLEGQLGVPAKLAMEVAIAGHGHHVVAYALAGRLIAGGAGDVATRERARVRMEQLLGGARLSDAQLAQWATAAERYARKRLADGVQPAALVPGSSSVLEELGLPDAAGASEVLPEGYAARCRTLAATLTSFLAAPSTKSLLLAATAEESLRAHAIAGTAHYEQRTRLCGIALRLCSWMVDASDREFATSDGAASWYLDEGGWVDSLRDQLAAASFGVAELDDAVDELLRQTAARRHELNRAFAGTVATITANASLADDGAFVGVEHVAGRAVAAVAEHLPALLLVIDGLSIAAWLQLQDSFIARGWDAVDHAREPLPRAALSTVPSVTRVARTSLFCGTVREGGEREEKAGLAAIGSIKAAIATAGARGDATVLHKSDLRGDGARPLAAAARATIIDPELRVVGVVVNAIDDLLAKADQANVSYSAELMPVLDAVLDAAAEGGRAIVITSDHGHVLDRGTTFVGSVGGAEARTHASGGDLADGEIEVSGTRIITPGGALVAAWSEHIRYTKPRSRGYHGGVSPQELVVPVVAMMLNGVEHPAFQRTRVTTPTWWNVSSDGEPDAGGGSELAVVVPQRKAPPAPQRAEPTLFDPVPSEAPPVVEAAVVASWVTRLVQTERLQSQLQGARRFGIREDQVVQALAALDARAGTAPTGVIAQSVGLPQLRVSGFLSALRRVLTWDGVDVLDIDHGAGIVTLNTQRLKHQFGVDDPQ